MVEMSHKHISAQKLVFSIAWIPRACEMTFSYKLDYFELRNSRFS